VSARTGPRHRLLIVDDQILNVRLMAHALAGLYELSFATTGVEALEIATGGGIDLVLLDVVMPGLDGFETCRRLKGDPRTAGIPVIFVTANEATEDEARGFDAGGVDYITKPIRPPVVRARVRTHLELKEARDLLERLASLDPLTGIPNRRRFDAALEAEWRRALRSGRPLSLAMVDIDWFKSFNDSCGHVHGDDCLRSVAQALAAASRRPADLVARFGGEEFAVLAPDTDADGMSRLLEELLARVAELAIAHPTAPGGRLTVSAGAVTVVPTSDGAWPEALEAADRLLYEVKDNGRAHARLFDVGAQALRRVGPVVVVIGGGT
jgi:diguanylate cyclase (GGDEF)-like protein